ncbi:MAG: major capsid protein E [Comamonadaceae bacterium CG_4_9_14_0_8_um_filter_57_21]|nr:MAG: major capsid protein E [Comamonadaceae bacterium CG_4_9_14_0_8_um_filter_57_21]
MAALDIFNGDAFSVQSLTKALNDVPHQPTRLGELGYFSVEGITTTMVSIEKQGTSLALVPAGERGGVVKPGLKDKRTMIPFKCVHLPQNGGVNADEVQNLRTFGSESELESVQNLVNKELRRIRRNLDATLEFQRMGAVKGQILDADGTTVLLDLYSTFGVSQQTHSLILGTAGTKVRIKVVEAKRKVEAALGGLAYSGLRVLCSPSFFDALVGHATVEAAFDRYQNGEFLRADLRAGFYFAGVFWEEYRGNVNGIDFIEAGSAYMIPEGVPDLFVMNFAPADYMETVNTMGIPMYAKQEPRAMNKGVDIDAQSNPLTLCTRPAAIVKLTVV